MKYIPGHAFTALTDKSNFVKGSTYRIYQILPLGKDGIKYIFTSSTGNAVNIVFESTEIAEAFINKISGVK